MATDAPTPASDEHPTASTAPTAGSPSADGAPPLTRASALWVATAAALLLLILLIVFMLQNTTKVEVHLLGMSATMSLGMALLIAAVGGGVVVAIAGVARVAQLRMNARRTRRGASSPEETRDAPVTAMWDVGGDGDDMTEDKVPPITVNDVVGLTNERHTTQGMAHDVHVVLTGRLTMEQAEQRLRECWPYQDTWPLTFEPSGSNSATRIVMRRVVDHRRDDAVERSGRACTGSSGSSPPPRAPSVSCALTYAPTGEGCGPGRRLAGQNAWVRTRGSAATVGSCSSREAPGRVQGKCWSSRRRSGPRTGQSCIPARMTRPLPAATARRSTAPGVRAPASALERARRYSQWAHPAHTATSECDPRRDRSSSWNVLPQHQQVGCSTWSCTTAAAAICPSLAHTALLTRGSDLWVRRRVRRVRR
jgi:uncharacterized integral membrane protein